MTYILMHQTPVGKRAKYITHEDAEAMVADGTAVRCAGYNIYEEVTKDEAAQGYMTRNMQPLDRPVAKKKAAQPKGRDTADEE